MMVGVARVNGLRCVLTGYQRLHLRSQTALAVVDFVDDVGRYFVTAVGKDAVTFCNTQRRGFACTQSHRQAGRDFRRLEAEALDVLLCVANTDRHQMRMDTMFFDAVKAPRDAA